MYAFQRCYRSTLINIVRLLYYIILYYIILYYIILYYIILYNIILYYIILYYIILYYIILYYIILYLLYLLYYIILLCLQCTHVGCICLIPNILFSSSSSSSTASLLDNTHKQLTSLALYSYKHRAFLAEI